MHRPTNVKDAVQKKDSAFLLEVKALDIYFCHFLLKIVYCLISEISLLKMVSASVFLEI